MLTMVRIVVCEDVSMNYANTIQTLSSLIII